MIRTQVQDLITAGLRAAAEAGEIPDLEATVEVTPPRKPEHGDLSTNVAMMIASKAKLNPREVATKLVARIPQSPLVSAVEIAGPGFINFRLSRQWVSDSVALILSGGAKYGHCDFGRGERVMVEFVSANPVGPLNVVNARAAAVGDTLVRLLKAAGYDAASEFYVNDAGRQVEMLAESVYARYMELIGREYPFPEDGYRGEYVRDIAAVATEDPGIAARLLTMNADEARGFFREYALRHILDWQKRSLAQYEVHFDRWFSERELRATGAVEKMIGEMEEAGHTYREEGALWFRSFEFGDDKDRVLVKSDGLYTYVAPDLAYHRNKLSRGFTKLIDILGPDHHGYEGRMQAGLKAFGYPDGTLEVLLLQLVTLMRDGQPVKMSKRAGEFITMDDLLEEVPRDAARYFFIMRNTSSHLDFDPVSYTHLTLPTSHSL